MAIKEQIETWCLWSARVGNHHRVGRARDKSLHDCWRGTYFTPSLSLSSINLPRINLSKFENMNVGIRTKEAIHHRLPRLVITICEQSKADQRDNTVWLKGTFFPNPWWHLEASSHRTYSPTNPGDATVEASFHSHFKIYRWLALEVRQSPFPRSWLRLSWAC